MLSFAICVLIVFGVPDFIDARPKFDPSVLNNNTIELLTTLKKQCHSEDLNQELIDKADRGEFVDDLKLKEYVLCLVNESGVMDEKGVFDLAPIVEAFPEDFKEPLVTGIQYCSTIDTDVTNLMEHVFKVVKCLHDRDPEHFFLY